MCCDDEVGEDVVVVVVVVVVDVVFEIWTEGGEVKSAEPSDWLRRCMKLLRTDDLGRRPLSTPPLLSPPAAEPIVERVGGRVMCVFRSAGRTRNRVLPVRIER